MQSFQQMLLGRSSCIGRITRPRRLRHSGMRWVATVRLRRPTIGVTGEARPSSRREAAPMVAERARRAAGQRQGHEISDIERLPGSKPSHFCEYRGVAILSGRDARQSRSDGVINGKIGGARLQGVGDDTKIPDVDRQTRWTGCVTTCPRPKTQVSLHSVLLRKCGDTIRSFRCFI